jgi:hypothetical protein
VPVPSSMLYLNRQLHEEATAVLYASNSFVFINTDILIRFWCKEDMLDTHLAIRNLSAEFVPLFRMILTRDKDEVNPLRIITLGNQESTQSCKAEHKMNVVQFEKEDRGLAESDHYVENPHMYGDFVFTTSE